MLVEADWVLDNRLEVYIGVGLIYRRWDIWWLWLGDLIDRAEMARLVRAAALMPVMRWYVTVPKVVVLELIGYFDPLFVQLVFKLVPFTPWPLLLLDLPDLLFSQVLLIRCCFCFNFFELSLGAVMALHILTTEEREASLFRRRHHILTVFGQVHWFEKGMMVDIISWVCFQKLLHLHWTISN